MKLSEQDNLPTYSDEPFKTIQDKIEDTEEELLKAIETNEVRPQITSKYEKMPSIVSKITAKYTKQATVLSIR